MLESSDSPKTWKFGRRNIPNFHVSTLSLLLLFFFLLFASNSFAEPPSPFSVEKLTGQPAPNFTAKDINGNTVSLSSFKGKVVLLKFWATWCPPCRSEIPSANKLSLLYADKGLVILAISTDTSIATVRDFLKRNPVSYTVLFDEGQKITKSLYKAFMVPTSFLIDRKGTVVNKYFGEHDWTSKEILKEIESYL